MSPILATLLPDALVMALGRAMRAHVPPAGWEAVDWLNFRILFPALIFQAAASGAPGLGDAAVVGGGVWAILGLGLALGWLARPLGPRSFLDFAGVWQTAWRFNSALGLVAVLALPAASHGLMPIAIGFAVPLANVLAVVALSRGGALGPLRTLRMVALNPFFLASTLGLACAATGFVLPDLLASALARLAAAAIPLALLSIGAALDWRALARLDPFLGAVCAIKLVALPAATLVAARLFGAPPEAAAALVVFAALPTASGSHVLASVFGADRGLAALAIAQMTLLGCATLPLWIAAVS
ncbi:AEC family transporter [Amaricoccus sp.]|uniref:AEC family transporter n=1 Tax=Amaricoccus sp. TaxID=1872485 RepID=UPI001B5C4CAC|nr:AEC family transporter [Amaricoccus sp.]MBP7241978.1 AEC family transporter [Amaricoccus sp.]